MSVDLGVELICLGEALIDFFPERPGISLYDCERYVRHVGGAPTNVAIGAARLGARVRLCSAVGDDPFGEFLRDAAAREGIAVDAVRIDRERRTGITFVEVAADGARKFLSVRVQSAIDNLPPSWLQPAWFDAAKILHLGSATLAAEPARSATFAAVAMARAAGVVVSVDLNWRPHLWPDPCAAQPLIRQLLASADLVKISDDELAPIFATDDPDTGAAAIAALGASVVVVTFGPKGSRLYARGQRLDQPAPRVTTVDATGAGDGFCAGMLSELVNHLDHSPKAGFDALPFAALAEATARGNEIGAQVVTALGATTAILAAAR